MSRNIFLFVFKISDKYTSDELISDKYISDKLISDKYISDKLISDKYISDELISNKYIRKLWELRSHKEVPVMSHKGIESLEQNQIFKPQYL